MSDLLLQAEHVEEPSAAQQYADILSLVAAKQAPVIVRRGGADIVAVVPLDYLDLLHDLVAHRKAEQLAAQVDWDQVLSKSAPAQEWFNRDEPKPF